MNGTEDFNSNRFKADGSSTSDQKSVDTLRCITLAGRVLTNCVPKIILKTSIIEYIIYENRFYRSFVFWKTSFAKCLEKKS